VTRGAVGGATMPEAGGVRGERGDPGMSVSCVRESEPLGTAVVFACSPESGDAKSDLLVCNAIRSC